MNPEDIPLTPVQFRVARSLAGAFSHRWSNVPDAPPDAEQWTATTIAAWCRAEAVAAGWPGWMYGIEAPDVFLADEESPPVLVAQHTTGTGRTNWEVRPGGVTEIAVCRPDRQILYARLGPGDPILCDAGIVVSPDRRIPAAEYAAKWNDVTPFFERHLHPLQDAMRAAAVALGVDVAAVDVVLAPLWRLALPEVAGGLEIAKEAPHIFTIPEPIRSGQAEYFSLAIEDEPRPIAWVAVEGQESILFPTAEAAAIEVRDRRLLDFPA